MPCNRFLADVNCASMVLEDMFFLPSNELPIYQKPNLPYMHDVARELEVLAVLMGEGGTKALTMS